MKLIIIEAFAIFIADVGGMRGGRNQGFLLQM
jgi:hypothetical protein